MHKVLKLSIVSFFNAFILYLFFLPMGNFYRIERITGWSGDKITHFSNTFCFILILISSTTLYFLVKKYLKQGFYKYWLALSWTPFYFGLLRLNMWLIPITEAGESPSPVTGLLMLFAWILYPLYLLLITVVADTSVKEA
jgi:hypothetical protein